MDTRTVGVLGGGQLGRMLAASASLLNINIVILDTGDRSPAKQILNPPAHLTHIDGSFTDPQKIRELAEKVDTLTVEIEHVDVDVLEDVERSGRVHIHPSPSTIRIIQDKFRQKNHLRSHGLPVADFSAVDSSVDGIKAAGLDLGFPLMLKSRTLAYDGRGNFVVHDVSEVGDALSALSNRPLYAERLIPLAKELAVMVVRTTSGEVQSYATVETVHKDNVCHLVFAPLRSTDNTVAEKARKMAEVAIKTFHGAGIFGVEMFLLNDGSLLINEIAPRPHNSGHYTIEACYTSQYENHLRAILSLPLGSTEMKVPCAAMLNLLGTSDKMEDVMQVARAALSVAGSSVHLYGKNECRKGRKMGHITLVADEDARLHDNLRPLLEAIPDSSKSIDQYSPSPPVPGLGKSSHFPEVGIIMGSDSDLPTMLPAARILDTFGVPYELTIVSAHRTPDRMVAYARSAASRGLRVIIAGAGGAAHLPGMVAAMTALPVIGVPVKGSSLDGVDSLHSIVQMPRGIPVATVAINNSTNAALLAVRVLGAGTPRLREAMEHYMRSLEGEVLTKVDKLERLGWETYGQK
ncbi:Phosphoribosylaminoimidazole carboxylase [Rickenella mellea]|uniref:Phosphoribosylaminoimidazole carboxylase n=1 Tax=Rickenella mellea TaxID=50990 RepID=A0A4Y7PRL6_9AGAM|nr:Phosphoribosylaminoimidazole carboxylase [Rickenella mellea]